MPKPLGQPGEQRNGTSWPPREIFAATRRVERAFVAPGQGRATRPRALRCASSARHRGLRPRVERLRRVRTRASGERAREPRVRGREVPSSRKFQGDASGVAGACESGVADADAVEMGNAALTSFKKAFDRMFGNKEMRVRARARDASHPRRLRATLFPHLLRPTPSTSRPSLTPLPSTQVVMLGLDAAGKTTILYKLHIGEVLSTVPTLGTPDPPLARVVDTRVRSRAAALGFALPSPSPSPSPSSHPPRAPLPRRL